jgi:hypothetical protein
VPIASFKWDLPGGAVLSFGIAKMGVAAEGLPRQWWVGEVKYLGAIHTVTLKVYGEAALVVTCPRLLSELGQLGRR